MLMLGRDIVHVRLTACAHDACCKTFFFRDCKITKHDMHGVPASVLKTKARIISIVLRYHSRLESVSLLVTARAHIVRRIALFFSRDAASHSRRVFRLWMLDSLVIIVDQFADSEGLPAMGHLEKLTSLFSRQEYCILRLQSLESTV